MALIILILMFITPLNLFSSSVVVTITPIVTLLLGATLALLIQELR